MPDEKLDLTALKKAAEAFQKSLSISLKIESKDPQDLYEYEFENARSALIQHFEITYELCWKTMKRYIEMDMGAAADIFNRKDLFRMAGERGLIDDFNAWMDFNRARNRTSHIYNEDIANEVYETAKQFINALKKFTAVMENRE